MLARIRSSLRRAATPVSNGTVVTLLQTGDFYIDLDSRKVKVRDQPVHLTPKEFDLLVYLMKSPGKVVTHRAVLAALWGGNYVEQNEYLRVFVGNLRKKIEPDATNPRYILTEPWVGYRFNPHGLEMATGD